MSSRARLDHKYVDHWGSEGPEARASIVFDAADPERARVALDRVYTALCDDIEEAARSYRTEHG
jgi:hypothetical protein